MGERSPIHEKPDIYRNPEEVAWKYVSLDAYFKVVKHLHEAGILANDEIHKLHIATIDLFNSSHNQEIMCARTQVLLSKLESTLSAMGKQDVFSQIRLEVQNAARLSGELIGKIETLQIPATHENQTRIDDGSITLAGLPMEAFASQKDYYSATLQLFGDREGKYRTKAQESFLTGFDLSPEELHMIDGARTAQWEMVDLITQLLLTEQLRKQYPSLATFEHLPTGDASSNTQRKEEAIGQAYYFIGKIMRGTACFATGHYDPLSGVSDPVDGFSQAAGKSISPQQAAAIRKVALAHASHGLNSGELTARLAGSVRTTFPRALIASFNIRSGLLHAGAIKECMNQTAAFLSSSADAKTYVASLLHKKELLYGFGHRIHKISQTDTPDELGKDPRVSWYIKACQEGFPEKREEIDKLIAYAQAIREARPSLGANTDFGASVLFHTLGLSANVATGFFASFRSPGLCAQIVNELNVKGNARRPPFPPVLPYPTE
jgi:citrate synthase